MRWDFSSTLSDTITETDTSHLQLKAVSSKQANNSLETIEQTCLDPAAVCDLCQELLSMGHPIEA